MKYLHRGERSSAAESIADPQVHEALVKRSQVTTIVSKKRLIIAVRMFVDSPPAQRLPLRLPRLRALTAKIAKHAKKTYRRFITSSLGSVISSIAYRRPSRPKPESLIPPYGI